MDGVTIVSVLVRLVQYAREREKSTNADAIIIPETAQTASRVLNDE